MRTLVGGLSMSGHQGIKADWYHGDYDTILEAIIKINGKQLISYRSGVSYVDGILA
jgi:hypothetical protein